MFVERMIGDASRTLTVLSHKDLLDRGIQHGFIGCTAHFRGDDYKTDRKALSDFLDVNETYVLKQIHSADVVSKDVVKPRIGDGWLIDRLNEQGCWLIFTADCLPLLINTERYTVLLHAGWRGLARGIIERGVQILASIQGGELGVVELVIGPAAGVQSYQVGQEVLDAIGPMARYHRSDDGYYLSLGSTASERFANAVQCYGGEPKVFDSGICTINNKLWHSFRRDGDQRGSNVMFIALDNNNIKYATD
jgi:copper oxidase (laccase) domain-containing protein